VVTGERAEESSARAKYKEFEVDRADCRGGKKDRHVDHWRPIHKWAECEVWEAMARHKINPHPAYRLGWGRLSCMACIFGSDSQWASMKKIAPERFKLMADYEKDFDCTIHRTKTLMERVESAKPYMDMDGDIIKQALSIRYTDRISVDTWKLPAGAFGENAGPT
jgi:3'-phosphoadenosine 5'-phosphosulfate sulfotransferase (PAPS reductase)/FAD synthetase